MSYLSLVRHGQASFGSENYDQLSDLGKTQSLLLGQHYLAGNIQFDHLVCGSMQRHRQTIEGIIEGASWQQDYAIFPQLNEYDFEKILAQFLILHPEETPLPHAGREVFYRLLRKAMKAWSEDTLPLSEISESWHDFKSRVFDFRRIMQKDYAGKRILAVSSGGAISMFLGELLSLTADDSIELNLQIQNSSVSEYFFNEKGCRLFTFNNTPHLHISEHKTLYTFS